jgi:hypothetical protein
MICARLRSVSGIWNAEWVTFVVQYATVSTRVDRMDLRIERIERRLDLTDA